MLFNNAKFKVNMTGTEYIKYRESKKIKLKKNQIEAIVYFSFSFIGILIIGFIISDLTYVAPTPAFSGWYEMAPEVFNMGWENIAKATFVYFGPFIVIVVGLAWLIHGFGFFIVKG